MHAPVSLVGVFFFRAVRYSVQYGMGLQRDDEDSVICGGT